MAGRNRPHISFDKDRKISSVVSSESLTTDNLSDFMQKVKSSGNPLYGDLESPRTDGLGLVQDKEEISESTQVLLDMMGVNAKASYLLDVINQTQESNNIYIPVTGNREVQKAISRVFPGSSPAYDKIFWEMWVAVVDNKVRQSELIGSELLEQLTGNPSQDDAVLEDTLNALQLELAKVITDGTLKDNSPGSGGDRAEAYRKIQQSDNVDVLKELLVYGAALIGLFFLNKKLATFKAPENHLVAVNSAVYPSPAGLGIMILQIIIGLAMHFMIEGLLADDVTEALEKIDLPGIGDQDRADIIQSALELASGKAATVGPLTGKTLNDPEVKALTGFKDDILNVVKAFYFRGDYDMIYEYGLNWLSAHAGAQYTKDDFSQWLILSDLKSIIYTNFNALQEAPLYSEEFNRNYQESDEGRDRTKAISSAIDEAHRDFIEGLTKPSSRKSPETEKELLEPDDMLGLVLENFKNQNCQYNDSINKLAAFLTHDPLVTTAVCCFIRYFGSVDLKLLYSIRSILMIFANGVSFDLGNFLNSLSSNIYDDLLNKARARLISTLNSSFSTMVNSISEWVDSETLELLTECLPIDSMITFVIEGIIEMQASLEGLIDVYLDHMQIQTYVLDAKISILAEQKWAKLLYKLIDALIQVAEANKDCAITGDPFIDENTKNLIDSMLSDPFRGNGVATYEVIGDNNLEVLNGENEIFATDRADVSPSLTGISRYREGIVTQELKDLLDIPSEFNTFTDVDAFYTDAGIKIDSIISNLYNSEVFQRTISSTLSSGDLELCFESIDQTELLKRVLRKNNGR